MVDALIKQDWSPEQISGRLYEEQGTAISHVRNHESVTRKAIRL
jgi:IS30 family transposase